MDLEIIQQPVALTPVSVQSIKANIQALQKVMSDVMIQDVHYGIIPGTKEKTLYKAGADKIGALFRLIPEFHVDLIELQNGHREVRVKTTLRCNGNIVGSGVGSCSTLEKKYRWRDSAKKCPSCNKETIIRGKKEYGGGWVCLSKKGGCGAKFQDGQKEIENQPVGAIENPDIADCYNTVLKIGKKRSYVDSIITATAASDIFTQDQDDFDDDADGYDPYHRYHDQAAAKQAQDSMPTDWGSYPFKYRIPPTVPGWNMKQALASLTTNGMKQNETDGLWYSRKELKQLASYLINDSDTQENIQFTQEDLGLDKKGS